MKNTIVRIIFLCVCLFGCDSVHSMTDSVKVTLKQPPKYKFNISSLWNITLKNNTNNNYSIELKGTADKTGTGIIVTATTAVFQLKANETKIVSASEITPIDVDYDKSYQDIIEKTGSFPAGDYVICVEVKQKPENSILGSECMLNVSVENFSQVQIISPYDGAGILDMYPVFTWLPPSPVATQTQLNYTLSIYEILNRQTAYNAYQSNPEFFELKQIHSSVYRYPAVSRKFSGGRKYAVRVKAFIDDILISESEIIEFEYIDSLITGSKMISKNQSLNSDEDHLSLSSASRYIAAKKIFKFGVSSQADFEASDKPGTYSKLNEIYGRVGFSPTVSVYDLPLKVDLYVASDQSGVRQNMNSFASYFNSDILNDYVKNKIKYRMNAMKDEVNRKVKERGEQARDSIQLKIKNDVMKNLSNPLKFFTNFNNLGIGVNYPKYTDYTVSGVSLTGVNIEFNPGLFYMAFTGPFNNKAIDYRTYKRNLYSGRLGVGKIDDSHLFFTMVYAKDYEESIKTDSTTPAPKENYVFGTEGELSLFSNKVKINGEVNVSFFTDDTQAEDVNPEDIDFPKFLVDFLKPKTSSRYDFFYKAGTSYQNDNTGTTLKAGVLMAGPGFLSLGSPSMRNDKFEIEVSADQKFLSNQLSARILFKTGKDNLIKGYKKFTTRSSLYNLNLTARFRNYPLITVNYYPYFLTNDASDTTSKLDNLNQNLTVLASYPLILKSVVNNTSLLFSWNDASTYNSLFDSYNWNLTLTNSVSFKSPLVISGSFGLLRSGITGEYIDPITRDTSNKLLSNNTYTIDLNAGYTFFEILQNTIGFNYLTSPDANRNLLFYINSTARFFNFLNADLRLEKSIYDDYKSPELNNNNLIFRATLTADWN